VNGPLNASADDDVFLGAQLAADDDRLSDFGGPVHQFPPMCFENRAIGKSRSQSTRMGIFVYEEFFAMRVCSTPTIRVARLQY
jgi:hypothetical protein